MNKYNNNGNNPFDEGGASTNPFDEEELTSVQQQQASSSGRRLHARTRSVDARLMSKKPNTINQRTRSVDPQMNSRWLRSKKISLEDEIVPLDTFLEDDIPQDKPRRGKKKLRNNKTSSNSSSSNAIPQWPYDNYHQEQQEWMDHHNNDGIVKSSMMEGGDDFDDFSRWLEGTDRSSNNHHAAERDEKDESIFERPDELCSIKDAVKMLNLNEFESTAKERAIRIIGKWLYDVGLIDELLVHGALSHNHHHHHNSSKSGGFLQHNSSLKMDKEMDKFRASVQRELTLVNSRLNDGVATSGAEVQELVNAVSATKSDLGQLDELNNTLTANNVGNTFLLAQYPRLKLSIHARRNLVRCFRELDFFSQIPSTCDRLRDELHSGEWTADEWNTIRKVCMEHVELEVLLIEAEAGMKAKVDHRNKTSNRRYGGNRNNNKWNNNNNNNNKVAAAWDDAPSNYQMVDKFLSQHVKNVWELGDEIRMKVMSGISTSFDLALNDPSGMVALVEAVEVYERAAQQYKEKYPSEDDDASSSDQRLHFTDMRADALSQLYTDFEYRCLEVFRAIHMQTSNLVDDQQNPAIEQFTAILRAANELVTEIQLVRNEIAPCFAPHWHVEVLWSACVAHVCSNQIIQIIGGPYGANLHTYAPTQLMDLIGWVEFFQETIQENLPNLDTTKTTTTTTTTKANSKNNNNDYHGNERPDLFAGDKKSVNMDNASECLAWVNKCLNDVHHLAGNEFLNRTREQTDQWITNVYQAEHEKNQTSEGRLMTSLCEDVFSLAAVQLRTIRERLSKKSNSLVMAVCLVFSQLRIQQMQSRNRFFQDLETCCAAANDFQRMSERCEDVMQELTEDSDMSEESKATLDAASGELLSIYSADAVYAAQMSHTYIIKDISEALSEHFFAQPWEEEFVDNNHARTLTQTLDDFMSDLEDYLEDFMLKKTVDALVNSSIVFYVKCLLQTAEKHKSNKLSWFQDNEVALQRMSDDIRILREYFETLTDGTPYLAKVVENGFTILTTIQELMCIAAGLSDSDEGDFIPILHKEIQDVNLTKHVVGDLWHLVQPTQERSVWELVGSLEPRLMAVCPPDDVTKHRRDDRMTVPGLSLEEMMAKLYIDSKRKRPVKAGAVEKMVNNWKSKWTDDSTD